MSRDLYIVGQPFPDERFKDSREGAVITFRETTFDVVILIDKPVAVEIAAFQRGAFTYGLFEKNDVPFLTLDFEGMCYDASFNILKLQKDHINDWMDSKNNAMNLYMVDTSSYRLEAIRSIGLHFDFLSDLKTVLARQQANYDNMHQVGHKILNIMRRHSIQEMNNQAKKFKIK